MPSAATITCQRGKRSTNGLPTIGPDLATRTRAREVQADHFADEIIAIVDTEPDANRARVRMDGRNADRADQDAVAVGPVAQQAAQRMRVTIARPVGMEGQLGLTQPEVRRQLDAAHACPLRL